VTIIHYLTSTIFVLVAVISGGLVAHFARYDRDYYSYGVLWKTRRSCKILLKGGVVVLSVIGLLHLIPTFVFANLIEHVPYTPLLGILLGAWVLDATWVSVVISAVLVIIASIMFFIGRLLLLMSDRPIQINVDKEAVSFAGLISSAMLVRRAIQLTIVAVSCLPIFFSIDHTPWPLLVLLSLIGTDLCLILYRRRRSLYGRNGLELAEAARYVINERRAGGGRPGHFKSVFSKKPVIATREAKLIPDATAGARS
jgi:hypothetical protein